jgi:hypothetical protein
VRVCWGGGSAIKIFKIQEPTMMMLLSVSFLFLLVLLVLPRSLGYSPSTPSSRRTLLSDIAKLSIGTSAASLLLLTTTAKPANASGGATAGKYTTIPIAKRRYYGRVQQAVHEFLELGPTVVKGDMSVATIQTFFDPLGVVVVPAKRKDVNGQCTKKDGDCRGKEIRDSRYNDMKASMYLLGNAFRTDQQKPPDRLRKSLMWAGKNLANGVTTFAVHHDTLVRFV